jgi:hypothetical protein
MEATAILKTGEDAGAVRIILSALERWQKLLENRKKKSLSLQQQIGLFGELVILRDLFMANLPPTEGNRQLVRTNG